MRRKNQNNELNEDDKYELQGWNNDPDDLPGCSNLLKILEKKITFPLLEKQHKKSRKTNKDIQNLPTIQQDQLKNQQTQLKKKKKYSNLSPIMKTQKNEKPVTPNGLKKQNDKLKKHKTEVSKLPVNIQHWNNNSSASNLPIFKQKNKSLNNFNRSYLKFFDSNKSPVQNDLSPHDKKILRMTKKNHSKAPSAESLAIKTKIAQLKLNSNDKQQQQTESKKIIRWDKFSISQDKLAQVYKKIESIRVLPKQLNEEKNQRLSKFYDKAISQKKSSSVWLQRLFQKKQFQNKALKTESKNFFLDDHLQQTPHQIKPHKNLII